MVEGGDVWNWRGLTEPVRYAFPHRTQEHVTAAEPAPCRDAEPAHAAACMQTLSSPTDRLRNCFGEEKRGGWSGPPPNTPVSVQHKGSGGFPPRALGLSLIEIRQLLGFLFLNRALIFIFYFRASALVFPIGSRVLVLSKREKPKRSKLLNVLFAIKIQCNRVITL